jgi:hypothetical protein
MGEGEKIVLGPVTSAFQRGLRERAASRKRDSPWDAFRCFQFNRPRAECLPRSYRDQYTLTHYTWLQYCFMLATHEPTKCVGPLLPVYDPLVPVVLGTHPVGSGTPCHT